MMIVCLGFAFDGKMGLEKTATRLMYPVGAFWLLLGGWFLQSLVARQRQAWAAGGLWLALTLCSTPPCVDWMTWYLETRTVAFDAKTDPPLDVVVVLGGGTSEGPNRAQAAGAGDRVVLAAQLYHQGHTARLITTGNASPGITGAARRGPIDHTVELWTQLSIPREDIGTLDGLNTFQEIQSLKRAIEQELAGKRIGLLTSASHLPRAMRLANAQGLSQLVPISSDHRYRDQAKSLADYLPGAAAIDQFTRCQHEFMAKLINR